MDVYGFPSRAGGIVALALALLTTPLSGQTPPDSTRSPRADSTVILIEGVVARAHRVAVTAGGASALEVRPDSLRISIAATLDDVLRALPLIRVKTNSRGESEPTLRGVESRHVAVLMDGVPISLGWDLRTDLAIVPMAAAEQVTLLRGLPSVLHGPNVLGGVVEIGVGRASDGPPRFSRVEPLQASASLDHLGGRALSVIGGHSSEPSSGHFVFRAGAGYRERPGEPAPRGIPATGSGLRENTDLQQFNGFLTMRYQGEAGSWLSLSSSAYSGERGVQAELDASKPRLWRYPEARRLLTAISGGTGFHETPWGEGDLEVSIGLDLGHTLINDYGQDRSYRVVQGTERGDDRMISYRLLGDHTLGRFGDLRAAATLVDINHREVMDADPAGEYEQRLWSIGSEMTWRLTADPDRGWLYGTRLSAGVAYDGGDTPRSGDKPPLDRMRALGGRVGVSTVALNGKLMMHAGLSRRARFPGLRELYSGALGKFEPNPGLRPERLTAGEAGATVKLSRVEAQAVLFQQRLADVIVKTNVAGGKQRRENRGEMRSRGVEFLTEWTMGPTALTADLTWQHVRILDPAAPTGERYAEYQPAVMSKLDWTIPIFRGTRATAAVSHLGRQWCVTPDQDAPVELSRSTRVDLQTSRRWERLEATLAVDNLADTAIYDQCGLSQPGRMLRFQIRFR
jgi:iron complex outermembrane receptor protein